MDSRVEDVVELTEKLVKVDSYARQLGENEIYEEINSQVMSKVLDVAEEYFKEDEGIYVKRITCEGRESLVATYEEDAKDVGLMLHGHLDVVAPDKDNYIGKDEEDHFKPKVETVNGEERIYGRGTGDMKAGVACLMRVMKELKDEKPDIGLMLVTDEEKGGFRGVKHLLDKEDGEGYSAEFGISAEPNNVPGGYLDIVNQQKGILRAHITAKGESAHASRKWKGDNAIEKLITTYNDRIKPIFSNSDSKTWETTANLGSIDGGDGINKVPDEATLGLDIRWSNKMKAEEVKNKIRQEISSVEGVSAEFTINEPMLDTRSSEKVEELQQTVHEVVGGREKDGKKACRITRKSAGSDARHFMRQDIPAVVFGPAGENSHQKDEYAIIDSFDDYVEIVKRFGSHF